MVRFPIRQMRRIFEKPFFLPDRMTVSERRMTGRDEYGDPTYEDVVVLASRCALRPMNGDEQVVAGQLTATATLALDYPQGVELQENMAVEVAGRKYSISYIERGSEAFIATSTALVHAQ